MLVKPEHLSVGGTSMQLQEHRTGTLPAPPALGSQPGGRGFWMKSSRERQKLWLSICTVLKERLGSYGPPLQRNAFRLKGEAAESYKTT